MKLTLVPCKQLRSSLTEGRDYGLGFSLAKRVGDELHQAYPISPCRDYTSDYVYAEATGKECAMYGVSAKKSGLFDNGVYVLFSVCKQRCWRESEYPGYDKDMKDIENNIDFIQESARWFEKQLGVEGKTKIHKLGTNLYAAEAPAWWASHTYLLSLYTLIIRCSLPMKDGDPIKCLENPPKGDASNAAVALPRVKMMFEGVRSTKKIDEFYDSSQVHNYGGIVNIPFPVVVKSEKTKEAASVK